MNNEKENLEKHFFTCEKNVKKAGKLKCFY